MAYTSSIDATDTAPAAPAERDILGELRDIEGRYNNETDATRRQALLDSYNRLNEYALGQRSAAERETFSQTNPVQSAIRAPLALLSPAVRLGENWAKLRDYAGPAIEPIFTGKPYDPAGAITPPVVGKPASGVAKTPAPTDWEAMKKALYPEPAPSTAAAGADPYANPYAADINTLLAAMRKQALPENVPTSTVTELAKRYDDFYRSNPYPKSNENPNSAMYNMFASMIHGPESSVAGALSRGAQAYGATAESQRKERGAYALAKYADAAHRFGAGLGAEQLDAASILASKMAPYSAASAAQKAQAELLQHAGTVAAHYTDARQRAASELSRERAAAQAKHEGSPAYMAIQEAQLAEKLAGVPGGAAVLESLRRAKKTSEHAQLMKSISDLVAKGTSMSDIAKVVAATNPELSPAQIITLLNSQSK